MKITANGIKYEDWSLLSERDIILLKALNITLLPEVLARAPQVKITPLTEYYISITFRCVLCNSEYTRHFHMRNNTAHTYLESHEVVEVPSTSLLWQSRKQLVSTCHYCKEQLIVKPAAELVSKLMQLSNRLGA